DVSDQISRVDDLDAGTIQLRAVDLKRAVEIEPDVAVAADKRQGLAFDNTEITDIAQVVALPSVAIDQQCIESGVGHGIDQPPSAVIRVHPAVLREKLIAARSSRAWRAHATSRFPLE